MAVERVNPLDPHGQHGNEVLSVEGVGKTYSGVTVLREVSLTLYAGEVHALVGENGAGKSTLVKILSGAIAPDTGEVRLLGQPVHFHSPLDAFRHGVGTVYQELTLVDNLSIGENVLLGHEPTRAGGILRLADLWRISAGLLKRVLLPHRPLEPVQALSVAQQQLLELSKALAHPLRVLILDEPTSALGPRESEDLYRLVARLKEEGLGIVYISHRLDEVLRIADRITVLKDGAVVVRADRGEIDETQLIRAMVGREVADSTRGPRPLAETAPSALTVEGLGGHGFHEVSFTLRQGEILALAGPVGSGAVQVAQVLGGVAPSRTGALVREHRTVDLSSPGAAAAAGIVFAPEDRKRDGLALGRSARENITMGILPSLRRHGLLSQVEQSQVVERAVREVSLSPALLDQECRYLSGGQQQKVLLARCLAARPRVLVLAEPTRGVDVGARAEIYEIIRRLSTQGMAILVVSSDTREVVQLCDRVIVMSRGGVVRELEGSQLTRESIVASASTLRDPGVPDGEPDSPVASRRRLAMRPAAVPFVALAFLSIVFALLSPYFLERQNLGNLARQMVVLGLASVGQMLVILTGGIDLSIGAVATLTNLVSASLLLGPLAGLAVPLTLLLGAAIGSANALLINFRVPAFLATYAMALIVNGLGLGWYENGTATVPRYFWGLSGVRLGPFPAATVVVFGLFALSGFVLLRTALGRHLFAFGRDPQAARVSGVRPLRMVMFAYVTCGLMSAMVGVFLTARIGSGLPKSASGLELDAIAAVMLGGASLFGGRITVLGTIAGVIVLTVISNGLTLLAVNPFYIGILRGLIMLAVVAVWAFTDRLHRESRLA